MNGMTNEATLGAMYGLYGHIDVCFDEVSIGRRGRRAESS
jgi:hypothetical protein